MGEALPFIIGAGAAIVGAVVSSAIPTLISSRNSTKLDEIHVLVNSNLTTIKNQLEGALVKIEILESALVKEQEKNAG